MQWLLAITYKLAVKVSQAYFMYNLINKGSLLKYNIPKLLLLLVMMSASKAGFAFPVWGAGEDMDLSVYASAVLDDLSSGSANNRPSFVPGSEGQINKNVGVVSEDYASLIAESQYELLHEYNLILDDVQDHKVVFQMKGVSVERRVPLNRLMTAWLEVANIKVKSVSPMGSKTFNLRSFWFKYRGKYTLTRLDI